MGVAERRERERKARRESIVAAAEQVFLERGVDMATMDDIAEAADLSKTALYLHFKGKNDLFFEVVLGAVRGLEAEIRDLRIAERDGLSELRAILNGWVSYVQRHGDSYRLAMTLVLSKAAALSSPEGFQRYRSAVGRHVARCLSAIERGQADRSIREDVDPRQLARQLWASLTGVLLADASPVAPPTGVSTIPGAPGLLDLLMQSLGRPT